MHFHSGAIQRHGFDSHLDDVLPLESLEDEIQYSVLGPTVHPRIDRMPGSIPLGKPAPLAAMFGNVEDGIDNIEVLVLHVAALGREVAFNPVELLSRYLHGSSIPQFGL